jgi:RHS repeat-associated protein
VSFLYNGHNQRVNKSGTAVAGGNAYFVYDEGGQLLGEYGSAGAPVYETIYLGSMPVGVMKQAGAAGTNNIAVTLFNVDADQIDTPRMITKQDHTIVWRWDTPEAFGATAPNQDLSGLGAFVFNQRFPGQIFDSETGLNQNWNREYNARLGGYIQSDPIGLAAGIDTFSYVGGRPADYADPLGLWSTAVHNQIIQERFGGGFSSGALALIVQGSASVDALQNQLPYFGHDYEHAMRSSGQSVAEAKRLTCEFIKRHMNDYRRNKDTAGWREAYRSLGKALHPIMDSTSPEHQGWQEWNLLRDWRHHGSFSKSREDWIHPDDLQRIIDLINKAMAGDDCACTR